LDLAEKCTGHNLRHRSSGKTLGPLAAVDKPEHQKFRTSTVKARSLRIMLAV